MLIALVANAITLNLGFFPVSALEVGIPGVGSVSIGDEGGEIEDDGDGTAAQDEDDGDGTRSSEDEGAEADSDREDDSDDSSKGDKSRDSEDKKVKKNNDDENNDNEDEGNDEAEKNGNEEDSPDTTESESSQDNENDGIDGLSTNSDAQQHPTSGPTQSEPPPQSPQQSTTEQSPQQSTEQPPASESQQNTEQSPPPDPTPQSTQQESSPTTLQQSNPQPPPEPPQQTPVPSELPLPNVAGITISETQNGENLQVEDFIFGQVATHTERGISENLDITDSNESGVQVAIGSPVAEPDTRQSEAIQEVPAASPPEISVLSTERLLLRDGENAEITFRSNAPGAYSIQIQDMDGQTVKTLEGALVQGPNHASWDGMNSSGGQVPAGDYSYHITAQSIGGVRDPPSEGDGFIEVAWPVGATLTDTSSLQNLYLPLIIVILGLASLTLYLVLRKKRLTLYLPTAASDVVQDILKEYPNATVEDYVEATEEGTRRYKGVVIHNRKSADKEWLTSIAAKTKAISGVNSVQVDYQGKMLAL